MQSFSPRELTRRVTLTMEDMAEVRRCRRPHNQLGFAYQMGFVRLLNRFPTQVPFELVEELVLFMALQLDVDASVIEDYHVRQATLSEHQQRLVEFLGLRRFDEEAKRELEAVVYEAATRLEQGAVLRRLADEALADRRVLRPADSTIARVVGDQRRRAREHIFAHIAEVIPDIVVANLDQLLVVPEGESVSPLQKIKANPGHPSVASMKAALEKLRLIEETGVLNLDLQWLNSNYQRALFHKVRKSSAHRLREAKESVRRAALVCFLRQSYGDAVDQAVVLFTKLLTRMEKKASAALDEAMRQEKMAIRHGLAALAVLGPLVVDDSVPGSVLRERLFEAIPRDDFVVRVEHAKEWVSGRKRDHLQLLVGRYGTLRKYAPAFLDAVALQQEGRGENGVVLQAVDVLRKLNSANKRKLPAEAPTSFLSKRWLDLVIEGDQVNRPAWECAVLLKTRDEIRRGNLAVEHSKRFGHLDDFFIDDARWNTARERFFARAGLPASGKDVPEYLRTRLGHAYDRFIAAAPSNSFAKVDEKGWSLSTDPTERMSEEAADRLEHLKKWLKAHTRSIRLPELLIEVDNDLGFTRQFMPMSRRSRPDPEEVCTILAAVMAQGCNIGPQTMARLTSGVTYEQLKRVGDWQLTRDTQREALAILVKAISGLDTSLYWGEGTTSASDGQRFRYRRKVLQRTYSPRFSDFALEFYTFVADNYAPFYSTPIECSDRDAATVLDGLIYNESDLELEEHFTDTHGYTEINFSAFAMLGRRFSPRIRGVKKQRLYRVDDRDYGALTSLVGRADRKINTRRIAEHWDVTVHGWG